LSLKIILIFFAVRFNYQDTPFNHESCSFYWTIHAFFRIWNIITRKLNILWWIEWLIFFCIKFSDYTLNKKHSSLCMNMKYWKLKLQYRLILDDSISKMSGFEIFMNQFPFEIIIFAIYPYSYNVIYLINLLYQNLFGIKFNLYMDTVFQMETRVCEKNII
jgi:hypothetical protein